MKRTAVSLLALALAGCTTAQHGAGDTIEAAEAAGRDCFPVSMISGFSIVDDDTIRVSVGPSRAYDLTTSMGACLHLRNVETIAVSSRSANFVCVGDGVRVGVSIITDRGGRCLVRSVRRATEESAETAAMAEGGMTGGGG